MKQKFIYDPALNDEFIFGVLAKHFPEYEIGNIMGHPKIKKNILHQLVVRTKQHKDKNKNIDYVTVFSYEYNGGCLPALMGFLPYYIIQAITKGSFYNDVENAVMEELNARFQSIE